MFQCVATNHLPSDLAIFVIIFFSISGKTHDDTQENVPIRMGSNIKMFVEETIEEEKEKEYDWVSNFLLRF